LYQCYVLFNNLTSLSPLLVLHDQYRWLVIDLIHGCKSLLFLLDTKTKQSKITYKKLVKKMKEKTNFS